MALLPFHAALLLVLLVIYVILSRLPASPSSSVIYRCSSSSTRIRFAGSSCVIEKSFSSSCAKAVSGLAACMVFFLLLIA